VQGPSRESTRPPVPAQGRPPPSRKRPCPAASGARVSGELLQGPLILAAVVGVADGRWQKEFACKKSGAAARKQLDGLRRGIPGVAADAHCVVDNVGPLSLHGFMIIRSWSWLGVHPQASPQTQAMKVCLHNTHQRSTNIQHLEHRIVTAAALDRPVSLDQTEDDAALLEQCINLTASSKFTVAGARSGSTGSIVHGFQALKTRWQPHLAQDKKPHVWKIWTELAHHIVRGAWTIDVTAVVPRLHASHWMTPVGPSRRLLSQIRKKRSSLDVQDEPAVVDDPMDIVQEGGREKRRGCIHAFHHGAMIRAVVGGQHLKTQDNYETAGMDIITYMLPDCVALAKSRIADGTLSVAKKKTLRHAKVRIDVAAMLANREMYARGGPLFRYLAADASPQAQQSVEVFVSIERVILRSAIAGKDMDTVMPADIKVRLLPICTLGHNRTDLASKALTQVPNLLYTYCIPIVDTL
jgi:hypothetical protein